MDVGIIGCGFVSRLHVEAWQAMDAKRIVYCDSDPSKKADYTDFYDMFKKESLDAVSVCTTPFNHAEIIKEALKHDCYVLVEKPFTCTSKEAEQFLGSKKVTVVHNEILESYLYEAWQFIKSGKLGEVYEANIYLMATLKDAMTANLNHWSYKMRGGRITECLPHPIYTAQCLLGQDDLWVRNVFARPFPDRVTYRELRCVLTSNNARANINVRLDALGDTSDVNVFGSLGVLKASLMPRMFHVKLYGKYNDGEEIMSTKRKHACMQPRCMIIRSLLDGQPIFTAEHAYYNIKIIDDILAELEK